MSNLENYTEEELQEELARREQSKKDFKTLPPKDIDWSEVIKICEIISKEIKDELWHQDNDDVECEEVCY